MGLCRICAWMERQTQHASTQFPSHGHRALNESIFLNLKDSGQQVPALRRSKVAVVSNGSEADGESGQDVWPASQSLTRLVGSYGEHSWRQLGPAHRRLKLRLPALPQPAETVLHPEKQNRWEKRLTGARREHHPAICEAWDKQVPVSCIPSPLDQGKIDTNKANDVLLMLVFLLKICYRPALQQKGKASSTLAILFLQLSLSGIVCASFLPFYFLGGFFEQRNGKPGRRGKR